MLKLRNICLPVNNSILQSTLTHETGTFFSWNTIQKFYDAMPYEIAPCKNNYEAKMYTCAILAVLSAFILPLLIPAVSVYFSAKKGGSK